jgi:hypothetical protein
VRDSLQADLNVRNSCTDSIRALIVENLDLNSGAHRGTMPHLATCQPWAVMMAMFVVGGVLNRYSMGRVGRSGNISAHLLFAFTGFALNRPHISCTAKSRAEVRSANAV